MEISSSHEEGEIPLPINSTYAVATHGHMIHHHHHNNIIPSSVPQMPNNNGPSSIDHENHHHSAISPSFKKMVKYRECLKNHAASMGGSATDGCGEFMPSGEEGSIEALTCSACNCHRNFHRKEIEGEATNHNNSPSIDYYHNPNFRRKVILAGHHQNHKNNNILGADYPTGTGTFVSSRAAGVGVPHHHHQQMIMSYNSQQQPSDDQSDEQEDGTGGVVIARPSHHHQFHNHHNHVMHMNNHSKKRFRTKFSVEQKEKMFNFAEKVGWKIQKQEESVVQQFCQEIGVKRRVLKVWMHNNKHNLAKKNHLSSSAPNNSLPPNHAAATTATTA